MINLSRDEDISLQISKTIGPAPWYWNTFPDIKTASGKILKWSFLGAEGEGAYVVDLASTEKAKPYKFLLNTYTRAFFIPPYYIGIWFENQEDIRIQCYNPDNLKDFELDDSVIQFKQKRQPYYCNGAIDCEIVIDCKIDNGSSRIEVPEKFKTLNEILIISSMRSLADSEAVYTLFALNINNNSIDAYPQKWFTAGKFDIGYQWITRITRDTGTGRFIGDGIRIGQFELCDDGMNLLRWI